MNTQWAPLPSRMIEFAVRALPATKRDRYRRELTAELQFVPPEDQLRYAARVLSRAWALRAALHQSAATPIGDDTMSKISAIPLTCRLHLRHTWRTFNTEDGNRYTACAKCGKELPPSALDKNTIGA